jgi:hypothetical protein
MMKWRAVMDAFSSEIKLCLPATRGLNIEIIVGWMSAKGCGVVAKGYYCVERYRMHV